MLQAVNADFGLFSEFECDWFVRLHVTECTPGYKPKRVRLQNGVVSRPFWVLWHGKRTWWMFGIPAAARLVTDD